MLEDPTDLIAPVWGFRSSHRLGQRLDRNLEATQLRCRLIGMTSSQSPHHAARALSPALAGRIVESFDMEAVPPSRSISASMASSSRGALGGMPSIVATSVR